MTKKKKEKKKKDEGDRVKMRRTSYFLRDRFITETDLSPRIKVKSKTERETACVKERARASERKETKEKACRERRKQQRERGAFY